LNRNYSKWFLTKVKQAIKDSHMIKSGDRVLIGLSGEKKEYYHMITKELIKRINQLARKKREMGLTPEEEKEQQKIRREYIDSIKDQLRPLLEQCRPDHDDHTGGDCDKCKH